MLDSGIYRHRHSYSVFHGVFFHTQYDDDLPRLSHPVILHKHPQRKGGCLRIYYNDRYRVKADPGEMWD